MVKRNSVSRSPIVKSHWQKRTLILLFVTAILTAIVSPKPQVISYRQGSFVAESVYWSGWFFSEGKFSDSRSQTFTIDPDRGYFYVCLDVEKKRNCQRYEIIAVKSVMGSIAYVMKSLV